MHLSAPSLALAALAFSTATSAIEMSTTITTGSVIVPVIFTSVTADNGDYYPLGYFLDGCKSSGNIKQVCRDTTRKRGHVTWKNGVRRCLKETKRNTVRDGKNSYEYITYTSVSCTW